ncbi:efflux RND transporter periplasmic adaptor subunit [Sphingomonas alpina]|uniref:Efflux RND transporter periplasmic adaptor subunit n=1 Tax=Sphingomonas alpina TaxID=653931 RepID=A0A7H0LKT2_9SPHN|nr:efflux RND transporter periplasmic adaptor subunit [Sphingomonas alpina]QNQ10285.1 efflux RND transporter periplasmic adaptor subunit [Sphingomonas alpina]
MSTLPSPDSPLPLTADRSRIRPLILAAAVIVLLFGGLYAWKAARSAAPAQGAPPATPVAAMVVQPGDVPAALEAVGSLRAVREVMLAPEVSGRVVALRVTAGATVGQGALLVQLYDAPERADRAAAIARANFASIQLARSQELAPTGAEPRELLQQRRAELDQARAAVQQIDARITQKQVRAPFSGQIGIRRANLGQYLNPGDGIATLTSLDQLYVDFTVPQQELSRLPVGGVVRVTSDAWPGRSFTARVNAIEPRIGEDTRNVTVQAVMPNPDRALRPGMYVTASLDLPAQSGALVVPVSAIQTSASGDSVTVVRGPKARSEGKAEPVSVTTGRRFGDSVIVTSGLKPGDVVVTEGQIRVQPGAQVRIVPARPAKGR